MNNAIPWLLSLLFPFFFVGMWCFVLRVISWMSGWSRLARQYAFTQTFLGVKYRFCSGRMQNANFSGCLTIGASREGFYVVPLLLFRLFHQPLLIPWHDIRPEKIERWFFKGYRLNFLKFPGLYFEVSHHTFSPILQYLAEQRQKTPKDREDSR